MKRILNILIIISIMIGLFGISLLTFMLSDYIEFNYDYTGYKNITLTENGKCKIPENWEVTNRDGQIFLVELQEDKTYFVECNINQTISQSDTIIHPIWGNIDMQENFSSGTNSISTAIIHGIFELESGEFKEIYILYNIYAGIALFSLDLADSETITKIYYSICPINN